MSQELLDNLAVLNIERDLSSHLWENLDSSVIDFVMLHGNLKLHLLSTPNTPYALFNLLILINGITHNTSLILLL